MALLLTAYAAIIILIGICDYFKVKNFDDFALAGRRRGYVAVAASILASVLGASATMGVVQLAYSSGAVAFLWLGSGAIGLIVSGFFIAGKVRDTGAKTLVEAAELLIGKRCAALIAFLIVIAWTGIIAAQFIAAAKLVAGSGTLSYAAALLTTAVLITGYCIAGGQISVLKTDFFQFIALSVGIIVTLVFLFRENAGFDVYKTVVDDCPSIGVFSYFLLIVGSGFVVGPDIFSRYFSATDGKCAKKAAITAGAILLPVSVAIVSIGLWARSNNQLPPNEEALVWILNSILPPVAGIILSLGLLSAIISSADTCLLTASAIVSQRIKNLQPLWQIRSVMLFIAAAATMIAWLKADIIQTLLLSYSIFNCGVIAPLFLAVVFAGKRRLNENLVIFAITAGGALGCYANFSQSKQSIALLAFAISTILSIIALFCPNKTKKT